MDLKERDNLHLDYSRKIQELGKLYTEEQELLKKIGMITERNEEYYKLEKYYWQLYENINKLNEQCEEAKNKYMKYIEFDYDKCK